MVWESDGVGESTYKIRKTYILLIHTFFTLFLHFFGLF